MVDIVEEILGPPPETHPPAPEIHGLVHVEDLQFVGVHYSPDKGILIGVVEDAEILSKLAHGLFEFLGMSREKVRILHPACRLVSTGRRDRSCAAARIDMYMAQGRERL